MVSKKIIVSLLLLVLAVVFTCGCFTATVHSTVESDATISYYRMDVETTQFVYNMVKEQAKEDGYSSVQSYMLAESENQGDFKYSESWDGDTVTMSFESTAILESDDADKLRIEKVDGMMVYEDSRFATNEEIDTSDDYSKAMLSGIGVHYYLEMPGTIVESNADIVDGKKAEWHLSGSDAFSTPIQATSEIPTLPVSGFTGLLAIAGFACAVGICLRCRD
ncbi:hypothetical protein AZH53_09915 [Methanomicrobiaceae archaeon CYW5]|uniref:hypothetical protein n=1 Tax=Methanovulcanius yangii TaxID=1789227 RepID=UPI0029CA64C4|nr:hypothetical protein [Methanovulcanius yangii]MBT8508720.1 hypothetical protein [Methanovulcanius yangii]